MSSDASTKNLYYRYKFDDVAFDSGLLELRVNDSQIKIERKPLELLNALLQSADEVLTKEELLEQVWPGVVTVDNVVANAIAKLRKALGSVGAERIVTHPRVGYRFAGPVERTVVGRAFVSPLNLAVGQPVNGRTNFLLEKQLSSADTREVWRARHAKTSEVRIFKFASDGAGLSSLKREVTLFRVLSQSSDSDFPVARILDWNFESEPFYIECEDSGINLKTWAETDHQLQNMSIKQRIDLACSVVQAVKRVHDAGIIHRDLKPSNILISTSPTASAELEVRLIDFGSSQIQNPDKPASFDITPLGFTREEDLPQESTPLYLAPEVVLGQPYSIQSDIYSLGIIIYQILGGDITKPLVTGWQSDIEDSLLIHDINEATQGNVAQRTSSTAILLDSLLDLENRHNKENEKKVLQRRAEEAELALQKATARRPWVYSTLTILIVGLLISSIMGFRSYKSNLIANENLKKAEAINGFLNDVLITANPLTDDAGPDVTIFTALERAQEIAEETFSDEPDVLLSIYKSIRDVRGELRDPVVIDFDLKSLELMKEVYGQNSEETLIESYRTARRYLQLYKLKEAQDLYIDTLKNDNSDSLAVVAQRKYTDAQIGMLSLDLKACIKKYDELLDILTSKPPLEMSKILLTSESNLIELIITSNFDFSQCNMRLGRKIEALQILKSLNNEFIPENSNIVTTRYRLIISAELGVAYLYNGLYREAEDTLNISLSQIESIYGRESEKYFETLSRLGQLYFASEDFQNSVKIYTEVADYFCDKHGKHSLTCANYEASLAISSLGTGGNINKLNEIIERSRNVFAQSFGNDSPYIQPIDFYLASIACSKGKTTEARSILDGLSIEALNSSAPDTDWTDKMAHLWFTINNDQCTESSIVYL